MHKLMTTTQILVQVVPAKVLTVMHEMVRQMKRIAKRDNLFNKKRGRKAVLDFGSTVRKYVTMAYGGALVPLILLGTSSVSSPSNRKQLLDGMGSSQPPVSGSVLIDVYVALAVGSSFCVLVRAMLLATAGYKTATLLFNKLHNCIFRSTLSGSILNRASTDQNDVDTTIPYQIDAVAFTFIQLVRIIAVMSQVAWQIFIVFIPVIAICIWYQVA